MVIHFTHEDNQFTPLRHPHHLRFVSLPVLLMTIEQQNDILRLLRKAEREIDTGDVIAGQVLLQSAIESLQSSLLPF